jgi:hypothetical protein
MRERFTQVRAWARQVLAISSAVFLGARIVLLVSLIMTLDQLSAAAENANFAGLVDMGGGRRMYLECRGTGSPTVLLISGKGNGAADWNTILDAADPVHNAPLDAVSAGEGHLLESETAVLPAVSRFTRDCRPAGGFPLYARLRL